MKSPAHFTILAVCLLVLAVPTATAEPGDAEKLIEAVFYQDLEGLREVIDSGVDLDARDPNSGSTALMLASSFGFLDMVELLLSSGADPNIADNRGMTALMAAAQVSQPMMELLLEHEADPGLETNDGVTVLTYSISGVLSGRVGIEVPALLLGLGVDVDDAAATGPTAGYTPLMMAAGNDHLELVEFLIGNGANVDARADDGATALSLAAEENYGEIVALLEKHGAGR
jgi:ankyrin repeat protein